MQKYISVLKAVLYIIILTMFCSGFMSVWGNDQVVFILFISCNLFQCLWKMLLYFHLIFSLQNRGSKLAFLRNVLSRNFLSVPHGLYCKTSSDIETKKSFWFLFFFDEKLKERYFGHKIDSREKDFSNLWKFSQLVFNSLKSYDLKMFLLSFKDE